MRFPLFYKGIVLALVTFCISSLLAGSAFAQEEQVADEIVAVVGDRIVLRSEVDGLVMSIIQQRQVPYSENLWLEALRQHIGQKVLTIYASRDTTIIVDEAQVEQALDQRVQQLTNQVGGQTQLEDLYGKSIVQIKDELRGEFRDRLLADQYRQTKINQIDITPTEVNTWFAQFPTDSLPTLPDIVRIAHIVRYPEITPAARAEAMEVITAIRDSVVAGRGTIEDYARRFSEDPGSAPTGGRATFRLSELAPEFAAVASLIPHGEISQPFQTQFGLHILRVNDRQGEIVDFNHILITFDESKADPTEAIAYLNTVRDSLLNHDAAFETMAKRHSEEQFSSIRGGRVVDPATLSRDLPLNALGANWQRTIGRLEEGEISEPAQVELLDGQQAYHILQLQRFEPSHQVDIISDYQRIREIALQEKQQREVDQWIAELQKNVYVDLRGRAQELTMAAAR